MLYFLILFLLLVIVFYIIENPTIPRIRIAKIWFLRLLSWWSMAIYMGTRHRREEKLKWIKNLRAFPLLLLSISFTRALTV